MCALPAPNETPCLAAGRYGREKRAGYRASWRGKHQTTTLETDGGTHDAAFPPSPSPSLFSDPEVFNPVKPQHVRMDRNLSPRLARCCRRRLPPREDGGPGNLVTALARVSRWRPGRRGEGSVGPVCWNSGQRLRIEPPTTVARENDDEDGSGEEAGAGVGFQTFDARMARAGGERRLLCGAPDVYRAEGYVSVMVRGWGWLEKWTEGSSGRWCVDR